jgi:hypothetical protein
MLESIAIQFAQAKSRAAKFLQQHVLLSVGSKTEAMASIEVKISPDWKYNSPTFGLGKLDYANLSKYS